MNILHFIFTIFLFVVLTPAILIRLPPKGNKWTVAFVHGLVFAVIYYLSNRFIFRQLEGLSNVENMVDVSSNKHKDDKHHTDVSGNSDKKPTLSDIKNMME